MRTNLEIAKELKGAIKRRQIVPNAIKLRSKERVYLRCDFEERNAVKILGAKWDSIMRKWYVDDVSNLNVFAKWIPNHG